MTMIAEKEYELLGQTRGAEDHDYDLIDELRRRLECVWRCDQHIANADGHPNAQNFWREIKRQDQENVKRLKQLIAEEIKAGCF